MIAESISFSNRRRGSLTRKSHRLQRALGHRQITTTEVYARVSDHSLRRAIRLKSQKGCLTTAFMARCAPPRRWYR